MILVARNLTLLHYEKKKKKNYIKIIFYSIPPYFGLSRVYPVYIRSDRERKRISKYSTLEFFPRSPTRFLPPIIQLTCRLPSNYCPHRERQVTGTPAYNETEMQKTRANVAQNLQSVNAPREVRVRRQREDTRICAVIARNVSIIRILHTRDARSSGPAVFIGRRLQHSRSKSRSYHATDMR